MEFLLAAIVKSSRRMRVEQLLLLAVRTLLVLLVVMALAKPYIKELSRKFLAGARTHRVLVLDGSMSMAYRSADKTLFDQVREEAVEIVRQANEGDGFTLILMSDTARVVVGSPSVDRGDFIEELENLHLLHGGADLPAALRAAEDVAASARQEQSHFASHHVYVFSDLGENTWGKGTRSKARQIELEDSIKRLQKHGRVDVIAHMPDSQENMAVSQFSLVDPLVTTRRPATLQAVVRHFGRLPAAQVPVELLVGGQSVDRQMVDLSGGSESATVTFRHRFDSPRDQVVEVRLSPDALDVDDHRYAVLPVRSHVRALCVSGKHDAARFLARGLDPGFLQDTYGVIRPQIVSESALLELELDDYDCVFLCNVGQFTASEARVLDAYVQNGGGLVFFLGDQVLAERYNRQLGRRVGGGTPLLPVKLKQPSELGVYRFDPLNYRHPLVDIWRSNPDAGLLSTPIMKYFQMEPTEDDTARVAMAFNTGDPAIVEHAVGRGRVVVVALPASTASIADTERKLPWTLSAWHSYPPIFQELLWFAARGKTGGRNVVVGESIGGTLEDATFDAPITIKTPRKRQAEDSLRIDSASGDDRWSYTDTELSGVYVASQSGPPPWQVPFAVNIDTSESDLTTIDPVDLPQGLSMQASSGATSVASGVTVAPPVFPGYLALLCGALVLAFVEVALAWWIGNRSL